MTRRQRQVHALVVPVLFAAALVVFLLLTLGAGK